MKWNLINMAMWLKQDKHILDFLRNLAFIKAFFNFCTSVKCCTLKHLNSRWLSMCACCVLERSGSCRKPDSAGFPPGPSACGASHWQAHPVRGSAGLPRPCTHYRCFTQLQRPFLHPPGRALRHESSCLQWHTCSSTHCRTLASDFFQCKDAPKNCF